MALISTQLIEAGVDVDFPVVYRAWAPADSLQQAAGRANRNARLAEGRVVIFRPSDGGQPRDASYRAALDATEAHFGPGRADPDCLAELERYYRERYKLAEPGAHRCRGGDRGTAGELDFPAVAREVPAHRGARPRRSPSPTRRRARHGPSSTRSSRRLRARAARARPGRPGSCCARSRPYMATRPQAPGTPGAGPGWAEPIIGDLLEWQGPYHPLRGIDPCLATGPDSGSRP